MKSVSTSLFAAALSLTAIGLPNPDRLVTAQTLDEEETERLLQQAATHFDEGRDMDALELYLELLGHRPGHYEALWNVSLLYTRKGHRQESLGAEIGYYETALEYAGVCLEQHSERPRCHYVYAISAASLADDLDTSRRRVKLVHEALDHIERAAEMEPDYPGVWHLKGVVHSGLASLSRRERLGARIAYGGLPESEGHEQAERYLERAIEMSPDEVLFNLDMAEHLFKVGDSERSRRYLRQTLALDAMSENDKVYQEKARELLNELDG